MQGLSNRFGIAAKGCEPVDSWQGQSSLLVHVGIPERMSINGQLSCGKTIAKVSIATLMFHAIHLDHVLISCL